MNMDLKTEMADRGNKREKINSKKRGEEMTLRYMGETGVVENCLQIQAHSDARVRSLAGKTVQVLLGTEKPVIVNGRCIGKNVGVMPVETSIDPLTKPITIMARFIQSNDPAIRKLKD